MEELIENWMKVNNPDLFAISGTKDDLQITAFKF